MSSHPFAANQGPILIESEAVGPSGSANVKLILDTAATTSVLNLAVLLYLGFDPVRSPRRTKMVTGSAVTNVPVVVLTRLGALGTNRFGFPVIAHSLPQGVSADGLLGLDFLRNHALTIDFRAGMLSFG